MIFNTISFSIFVLIKIKYHWRNHAAVLSLAAFAYNKTNSVLHFSTTEALELSRRDMTTSPVKSPTSFTKPTSLSTVQKTPDAR